MLLLHSFRYTNHGILTTISSCEIPPAAHCSAHHSISSRPFISSRPRISSVSRLWLAFVEFNSKGPAGRYHGSSSISRRRAIAFACGNMTERNFLHAVIMAYIDLIGRNSQVERRMSGGRDARVRLAFRRVGSALMGYGKLGIRFAARVSAIGKLVYDQTSFCTRMLFHIPIWSNKNPHIPSSLPSIV